MASPERLASNHGGLSKGVPLYQCFIISCFENFDRKLGLQSKKIPDGYLINVSFPLLKGKLYLIKAIGFRYWSDFFDTYY